jgi:hypothetical protein
MKEKMEVANKRNEAEHFNYKWVSRTPLISSSYQTFHKIDFNNLSHNIVCKLQYLQENLYKNSCISKYKKHVIVTYLGINLRYINPSQMKMLLPKRKTRSMILWLRITKKKKKNTEMIEQLEFPVSN